MTRANDQVVRAPRCRCRGGLSRNGLFRVGSTTTGSSSPSKVVDIVGEVRQRQEEAMRRFEPTPEESADDA